MKRRGIIQSGPYAGQKYEVLRQSEFPRWVVVKLTYADDCCLMTASREVREECLEQ